MELITIHVQKKSTESCKEAAEAYIRANIIGKENPAVLVTGTGPRAGTEKVFHVLVLEDIKAPLQFDDGKIYRHQIEEGREGMYLEYLSKHTSVFVCK